MGPVVLTPTQAWPLSLDNVMGTQVAACNSIRDDWLEVTEVCCQIHSLQKLSQVWAEYSWLRQVSLNAILELSVDSKILANPHNVHYQAKYVNEFLVLTKMGTCNKCVFSNKLTSNIRLYAYSYVPSLVHCSIAQLYRLYHALCHGAHCIVETDLHCAMEHNSNHHYREHIVATLERYIIIIITVLHSTTVQLLYSYNTSPS